MFRASFDWGVVWYFSFCDATHPVESNAMEMKIHKQ